MMIQKRYFIYILLILSFSSLHAQAIIQEDSLVLFQLSERYLSSNPPAKYSITIRNDMTISFYRFIPENSPQYHRKGLEKCAIDSCTISLDTVDYFTFEQVILSIDLENPNCHLKKEPVMRKISRYRMGGGSHTYNIVTVEHSVKYHLGGIMLRDRSEPFINIRNLIKKLENKYKPL